MQPLSQRWNEADVQALIDELVEEGQHLDYKDSRAVSNADWKKDVCKDVSAMANADGGVIIYGVTEEEFHEGKKRKIRPQGFDNGIDPTERSKEQIVQVINDGLQRRPEFFIDKVELAAKPGRVCYVIRVPKSLTGAHQLTVDKDYRYYQRQETETKVMQDWQIRDVMNRQSGPELVVTCSTSSPPNNHLYNKFDFNLLLGLKNLSLNPASYAIATVWIDAKIQFKVLRPDVPSQREEIQLPDGSLIAANKYVIHYAPKVPIFGKHLFGFLRGSEQPEHINLHLTVQPEHERSLNSLRAFIKWEVQSPNMVPKEGFFKITTESNDNLTAINLFVEGIEQEVKNEPS